MKNSKIQSEISQEIARNHSLPLSSIDKKEVDKELTMKSLKHKCERDREKVKGIFRFHECEGGQLSFSFRAYKWDTVERYTLVDGEIYELPLGVAKHLNKNGWYPVHHYLTDKDGKPQMSLGSKKKRFSFQSMDFMDPEELGIDKSNDIVTVSSL